MTNIQLLAELLRADDDASDTRYGMFSMAERVAITEAKLALEREAKR